MSACARCPFRLLNKLCTYSIHRRWMTTYSKAFLTSNIRLIMRNLQENHISTSSVEDFLGEFYQYSVIVTWWFHLFKHTRFALLIKSLNWLIFAQSSNMRSKAYAVQPCLKTWGYVVTMSSMVDESWMRRGQLISIKPMWPSMLLGTYHLL